VHHSTHTSTSTRDLGHGYDNQIDNVRHPRVLLYQQHTGTRWPLGAPQMGASPTESSSKFLSPRISNSNKIFCFIMCHLSHKYVSRCLARVRFCVVQHDTLHSVVSLYDGCQIRIIGYALKGLDNQLLRMSPRFTTRSNMPIKFGHTSSPARNAAETTLYGRALFWPLVKYPRTSLDCGSRLNLFRRIMRALSVRTTAVSQPELVKRDTHVCLHCTRS
jgi:hypothetical protein